MFTLSSEPIDAAALRNRLVNHAAGALVVFDGRVRDENEGRAVGSLEYEAYPELCRREAERILGEARARFGVHDVLCVHRTGHLALGETAIWLGVLSGHRGEAFDCCRWLIDELKQRLPIWKREHYLDGRAEWVRCETCAEGHRQASTRPCAPSETHQATSSQVATRLSLPGDGA